MNGSDVSGRAVSALVGSALPEADRFRGRFISFEGGDGAGKSVQIARLADRLRAIGLDVVLTREPGGSPGAERIRRLLLEEGAAPLDALAETLLFFAARQDHLAVRIRPALLRGAAVLCDRFIDSTMAYQGAAGQVPIEVLARLSGMVIGATMPDATIILDIDPEIGLQRAAARRASTIPDRFEAETLVAHRTIRQGFLDIARDNPARCGVVDAGGDADAVEQAVLMALDSLLPPMPSP